MLNQLLGKIYQVVRLRSYFVRLLLLRYSTAISTIPIQKVSVFLNIVLLLYIWFYLLRFSVLVFFCLFGLPFAKPSSFVFSALNLVF